MNANPSILPNSGFYTFDGTCRAVLPETTLKTLTKKLSDIGISRVADITGLDNFGVPVVLSIRPNAKQLSVAQGKGLTLELAKISAIMESFEAYHAEHPPGVMLRDSYETLHAKGLNAVSLSQFQRANIATHSKVDEERIDWVSGCSLVTNEEVYIPHMLTCMDLTKPNKHYLTYNVSSNGLAAGNTLEEAACHALYELIERDALSEWQTCSLVESSVTLVDLSSLEDCHKQLVERIHTNGMTMKLWCITHRIGIPTYHCAIFPNKDMVAISNIYTGTGTHHVSRIAVSRAITEAIQSRLVWVSGSRDDIFPEEYNDPLLLDYNATDMAHGVQYNKEEPNNINSFEKLLNMILSCLKKQNMTDIYLVDHTKAKIGVPVVQVIAPSLKFNGSRLS